MHGWRGARRTGPAHDRSRRCGSTSDPGNRTLNSPRADLVFTGFPEEAGPVGPVVASPPIQ